MADRKLFEDRLAGRAPLVDGRGRHVAVGGVGDAEDGADQAGHDVELGDAFLVVLAVNAQVHWQRLAAEKDRLAVELLEASGQLKSLDADLGNAISEERYENDALYPKMIRDVEPPAAEVFQRVVTAQAEHLSRLEALRDAVAGARGDVAPPTT